MTSRTRSSSPADAQPPTKARAAGTVSTASGTDGEAQSSSPLLEGEADAGRAVPGPGVRSQRGVTAPGRGRTRAPVTAVPDGKPASGPAAVTGPGPAGGGRGPGAADDRSPSAGSTPLPGKDGRDAWKAAQSAHNAAKRRGRTKRAPKTTGPGMIRREPPDPPAGAA